MEQKLSSQFLSFTTVLALLIGLLGSGLAEAQSAAPQPGYPTLRMPTKDYGIVLRYGDGPDQCDEYGARDVWVWQDKDTYYMNYDGAGPTGWLVCNATSDDGVHWSKHGAVIDLGKPGSGDSATASFGVPFFDGTKWRLYYLGSDQASPPPDRVPIGPYHSFEAESDSPRGPWKKHYDLRPFTSGANGAGVNSSPGSVVKVGDEYLMFYTGLGIARTRDLDKPWKVDPTPLLTPPLPCENASVYYEPTNDTWFLFTDHIGFSKAHEAYTDGAWVFWTKDVNHWDPANKAIVLDGTNCSWSKTIIGLPSVMKIGNRLAVYYDGREDPNDHWHMKRHIGLAWLDLPLQVPQAAQP